ncbi:unnamed protein product [Phytomonas sp. EM1]|nr:unnamed protein product [Phytomonas sp. EM1]|eukprot:CCW60274.1 unnamed protein product [Phytomonas sp. isolate EM1]
MPQTEDTTVGKLPYYDVGSLLKVYYNFISLLRKSKPMLSDSTETFLVGSGKYTGSNTSVFVTEGVHRLLYFSYRNCFSQLPNGSTTDSGWGCLLRTGQMVLGQVLMRFNAHCSSFIPSAEVEKVRQQTQPLFMDTPTAPFSIHQLELEARKIGVACGMWLSPTQVCRAMHATLLKYYEESGRGPYPVCCIDRDIVTQTILPILERPEPVVLLIPVALGIDKIGDRYEEALLHCLKMKSLCGIAGGYRHASYYLCGCQQREVLYLNPHYIQEAYVSEKTAGNLVGNWNTISVEKLDPCMLFGFYIANKEEFIDFLEDLKVMNSFLVFPLITVSNVDSEDNRTSEKDAQRVDAANGDESCNEFETRNLAS